MGAFVLVVVVGGAVLVQSGGDDPERVATGPVPTTAVTAPPTTTTTLVVSPELIVPPASADAAAATLSRVERALRSEDRDPARLRVLGWEQQLAYRQLSNHNDWIGPVLAALPADVRPFVAGNLEASAALSKLTVPGPLTPLHAAVKPPPGRPSSETVPSRLMVFVDMMTRFAPA